MKTGRLFAIGTALIVAGLFALPHAQADIVTYTNQAAWEAALDGAATLEDFEGQLTDGLFGLASSATVSPNGDLALSANANFDDNAAIDVDPYISAGAGINGRVVVNMRFLDNGSGANAQETVTVGLPSGLSAFAFEYNNYDSQGDGTFLSFTGTNGGTVAAFDSTSGGFFGVVDTDVGASILTFAFTGDPNVGTGLSAFNSFDDVRYGNALSSVPEPASALLLLPAMVGLLVSRRRR